MSGKLIILASFLLFVNLLANDKGSISGVVTDKTTQVLLKDILIELIGTDIKTKSLEDGSFRLTDVPYGVYEIKFSSASYQTFIQGNIIVSAGNEIEVSAELLGLSTQEVVIEDFRFQKPIEINSSFKSLTFEEIRRFPGGLEDIGRVIQSLPGVSISSDGRNDLLVRGGSPAENLFVVDGFEVNNFNHFGSQGSTGGPISIINLDLVSKVSFITGGFSARYGDRLSSVTDIEQNAGMLDKIKGKVNLSGTGLGFNLQGPLPLKNRSGWLFAARRSYLDIIFNAAGFGFVPEYNDFQLKADFMPGTSNFIEFNTFGAIDRVKFNNDTEEKRQDNERILTNNQNIYSAGFSWKSILSKNSYVIYSLSRNYSDYFFSKRDSLFNETFRNESTEGDVQLKLDYFRKLGMNTFLSFGIAGKTIKLDYDIYKKADTLLVIDPVTGTNIIIPEVGVTIKDRTYKANLYGEIIQKIFNRIKLVAGIRYDYFALIEKKNYVSPRASLSLTINPQLSFNIAYGIFFQSPSYIWLYGSPQNTRLEDIRADHYIAGIEFLFDESTRLTAEAYYKIYSKYPVSKNRPYLILANNSGFETQNSFGLETLVSLGKGNSKGIEIFLQKALTESIYGAMSISYSDARFTALDGIERRSDWDNRIVFNINGGYKLGNKWEFSAKFRYAGGRPFTPIDPQNGYIDYTLYNTERLPAYHRLDVRAERKWNFRKWTLTAYIDIQNLYNRKNVNEYRWNQFTRKIETGENLGILPTIGVSAEF